MQCNVLLNKKVIFKFFATDVYRILSMTPLQGFNIISQFKMINMNEIPWDETCTGLPQKRHPRGPNIQSDPAEKLKFVKPIVDMTKERQRKPVECLLHGTRDPGAKEVSGDALKTPDKR